MQGTQVIDASDDQDTTDLHKCVAYIQDLPNLKNQDVSIVLPNLFLCVYYL